MAHVLILKSGKVMVFSVKSVADLYRINSGGTLVSTFNTQANIQRIKDTYVQST